MLDDNRSIAYERMRFVARNKNTNGCGLLFEREWEFISDDLTQMELRQIVKNDGFLRVLGFEVFDDSVIFHKPPLNARTPK